VDSSVAMLRAYTNHITLHLRILDSLATVDEISASTSETRQNHATQVERSVIKSGAFIVEKLVHLFGK